MAQEKTEGKAAAGIAEAPAKKTAEKKTKKSVAAKKPAAKQKATKNVAAVKAEDLKKIDAKIDELAASLGKQLALHDGRLQAAEGTLNALRKELSTLPAEMQAVALERAKKHIAEHLPTEIRDQVYKMADTVLLYGIRDSVVNSVLWVGGLFKKLGGVFIKETTEKVKAERKRHKAAREGEEPEKGEKISIFTKLNPFGRKQDKPEEAAAVS